MAQHRSIRGTFTSKVKEAMNYAFGIKLPLINAQTTPSQVQDWKKNQKSGSAIQNYSKK